MKNRLTLWGAMTAFIFFTLLSTGLIIFLLSAILIRSSVYAHLRQFIWLPFVLVLFASVFLGMVLSLISSRRFMRPLFDLRDAMKRVSAGDFKVRVADAGVAEMRSLMRDFNRMVAGLSGIETLRDDFVMSVSHEIKTPIAAIEGCVALLLDESLTEEERLAYTNLLALGTKRLSMLSSNILNLAKLENQEILTDREPFWLDENIRQAILLLEAEWTAKKIQLNISLTPTRLLGNRELLMQAWVNLIQNAIKFSKEGDTVFVSLYSVDDNAYVSVKDQGIGMDEETQKHIFNKFFQGDRSRSTHGNGLGLSLAKRIIEMSGGTITANSEPQKGSVFLATLPLSEE